MIRTRSELFLAATLVLGACGGHHEESHLSIVNGSPVKLSDPVAGSTVAIATVDGAAFCTGTLIATDRVLTAGHCIEGIGKRPFGVVFGLDASGEVNTEEKTTMISATKSVTHPKFEMPEADSTDVGGYGDRAFYDLALVKLDRPAPAGYKAVPLAKKLEKISQGESLILVGFGETMNDDQPYGILRKVETTFERSLHGDLEFEITPGDRNSCHGDSGGPAFIERNGKIQLLGVVSRGDADCKQTGIYTDVRPFGGFANKAL